MAATNATTTATQTTPAPEQATYNPLEMTVEEVAAAVARRQDQGVDLSALAEIRHLWPREPNQSTRDPVADIRHMWPEPQTILWQGE